MFLVRPELPNLRKLHILVFSMSTAYLAISLLFLFVPRASFPLSRLEYVISEFLGIHETHVSRNYLQPVVCCFLALVIAALFLIFAERQSIKWFLRAGSGVVLLLSQPVYWLFYYQNVGWPFRWPYRFAPVELGVVVLFLIWRLRLKRNLPWSVSLCFLIVHFTFWYTFGSYIANYGGPVAPTLTFVAALIWDLYSSSVEHSPKTDCKVSLEVAS
jgi:hypothetical protein